MEDAVYMRLAIALSRDSAEQPGTAPFAAVVVKDGEIVGQGLNHVAAKFDPTAHGEIEAIRDACAHLKSADLSGATLYASCEPCAMCTMAMYRAGIARLVFGITLEQSAALLPPPVDAATILGEVVKPVRDRSLPAKQALSEEALEALAEWVSKQEPT